jgi:N-methylhydantoinase A
VGSGELTFALDMRYVGQAYEIEVPIEPELLERPHELVARFHRRHEEIHRHADVSAPVEVINLRVHAVGRTPGLTDRPVHEGGEGQPRPIGRRRLIIDDYEQEAPVFERSEFAAGARLSGPCLVEQQDTTVAILSGWTATVDTRLNLEVTRDG